MTSAESSVEGGRESTSVLFIRGLMPRAGTNFLMDALAQHPRIRPSPGEFWEFAPFRFQSELMQYLKHVEASHHVPEFRAEDFLSHVGDAWMRYLAGARDANIAVYKEPSVHDLEAMFQLFPRAKAVFIVRDGRDLVASLLKAGFLFPPWNVRNPRHWRRLLPGEEFRIACRQVAGAANRLAAFVQSEFAMERQQQWRLIHFEELFRAPRQTIGALLEWLDLSVTEMAWDALARMPVRGSSFLTDPQGGMNFGSGIEKPPHFNPIGRWQHWTPRQKRAYERIAATAMSVLANTP
jgi:hypothetical protein